MRSRRKSSGTPPTPMGDSESDATFSPSIHYRSDSRPVRRKRRAEEAPAVEEDVPVRSDAEDEEACMLCLEPVRGLMACKGLSYSPADVAVAASGGSVITLPCLHSMHTNCWGSWIMKELSKPRHLHDPSREDGMAELTVECPTCRYMSTLPAALVKFAARDQTAVRLLQEKDKRGEQLCSQMRAMDVRLRESEEKIAALTLEAREKDQRLASLMEARNMVSAALMEQVRGLEVELRRCVRHGACV